MTGCNEPWAFRSMLVLLWSDAETLLEQVHQHVSMTVVLFIQDLGSGAPQEPCQGTPNVKPK